MRQSRCRRPRPDAPVNKKDGPRRPDTWPFGPLTRREPRVAATNMRPGKSNPARTWWRPALSSGQATSNHGIRPRDERYGYYAVACVLGSLLCRLAMADSQSGVFADPMDRRRLPEADQPDLPASLMQLLLRMYGSMPLKMLPNMHTMQHAMRLVVGR